jgi:hypothetical protein
VARIIGHAQFQKRSFIGRSRTPFMTSSFLNRLRSVLIIIIVVVLLLGGGGFWYRGRR